MSGEESEASGAWINLIVVSVVIVFIVVALGISRPRKIEKWLVIKWNED